jgi:HlyD family secretion protein
MKKTLVIITAITLIIVISIIFYFKNKNGNNTVELVTAQVQEGTISTSITATGTLQPVDTVAVGTQVSGTIQNIYADFNSVVKKGQLLAVLDKSLFNAQVEQYTANLQSMTSQLIYQQQNFNRQTQLYKAGAISQSDYQTAESQYKDARGAEGSARAQLATAHKNLSFASIYSPINGTVLSRNISEGQTVAASFNTPTLFTIAKDLTKMQVRAAVDEADIGNVKAGQQVNFTVDAFPNDTFPGIVQEIRLEPVVTANVVTYTTIIDAPNTTLKLKPGMTANITIFIKQQNHAALLPAKAINFNLPPGLTKKYNIIDETNRPGTPDNSVSEKTLTGSKTAIAWILKGNKLIKKNIVTGLNDDIHVQVLAGLEKNDIVVVGLQQPAGDKNKSVAAKSPFMPSRRPSGTNSGSKQSTSNPK